MANKYDFSIAEKQVKKFFKKTPVTIKVDTAGLSIDGENIPFKLNDGSVKNFGFSILYTRTGEIHATIADLSYTLAGVSPQEINDCNRNMRVWKLIRMSDEAVRFNYQLFSVGAKNLKDQIKNSFEAFSNSDGVCKLIPKLKKK